MRVLLTVHQFFPEYRAGTEVLTCSVARELMARGHDVRVLTAFPSDQALRDEDRFDEYEYERIHVYRFHHAYVPMGEQRSKIEVGYDNRLAQAYFERIVAEFKPDVVHFFHLNRLGTGLIESAVRAGIPAFMTPTDFWVICPTTQLLLCDGSLCGGPSAHAGNCIKHYAERTHQGTIGALAALLPTAMADVLSRLTQADALPPYPQRGEVQAIGVRLKTNISRLNRLKGIVAPSRFITAKLVEYGVSPGLIVQSAFGIDGVAQPVSRQRAVPRQPFRIGFIGTLVTHKGCHVLIEAFHRLPRGQAVLQIYGSTQDFPLYSNELRQLSAGRSDIEFCGTFHHSKIAEVMAEIDVLVVPSLWYENTPLVVYSAQAARCPVIASDLPGLSEVVQDRVNGLLFETGDAIALAKKLSLLIAEPELVGQLSANAHQPKSTSCYVDELVSLWESARLKQLPPSL